MKKENQLITELCKFLDPDKERIRKLLDETENYPVILGQLLYNRMGGVAYYTLKECRLLDAVPREFRNALKDSYNVGIEKASSFSVCLDQICEALHTADFDYALLKGAYLNSIYPEGLRTSNDVDILIERKNLSAICKLLKRCGYTQGNIRNGEFVPASRTEIVSSMMNRGETVPFIKEVDLPKLRFCEIDLNFSMDYKPTQDSEIMTDFLTDSMCAGKPGMKILSKTDFLIHLCLHIYKEATVMAWVNMHRDMSLYKFCDIYVLLDKWLDENFAKNLITRIGKYELQKECWYAFIYTRALFGIRNSCFDRIISGIEPQNTGCLREVIDPGTNTIYEYRIPDEISLEDWFFTIDRKRYLHETSNEEA